MIIAPQVEHGGNIYQPPDLHASIRQAIRLPSRATPYGKTEALFANIRGVFERYVGLPSREAALLALWVIGTWFSDCLSSPPTLSVSGPDMSHGVTLFLLLSCLCRHPLLLTDITRGAFCSLVMLMRATLLVSQPGLSPKILDLWRTSNFSGVVVPWKGGTVANVACSKAFFGGMQNAACPWSDEALHLALPPAQGELPPLDEHQQAEIANRFQPQLLMYRLRNFRRVRESRSAGDQSRFPNSELARNLLACIQEEPEIAQTVAPLLQRQEQDAAARRGCDANLVIVEVIWTPSHQVKEISVSRITELTNTLLRCRGETLEFSVVEIGWKMRDLGLYRHRNGSGMALQFSRENRLQIHRLAQRFGLNLPVVNGCSDCVSWK